MLEDYRHGLNKPSFRQVFDQIIGTTPNPSREKIRTIYGDASRAESEYMDVHCHVWTYESFLDCWRIIDALGIVPLKPLETWEPFTGANEFIVSFVKSAY
jgi:hypothetical protein